MPSQISLRTSPVLSNKSANRIQVGHKLRNPAGGDGEDMKAAARTIGSLLVTHKSIRKPHHTVSVGLNGSCGRTDSAPKCVPNGNITGNMNLEGERNMNLETNCHSHSMNGTDTPPLNGLSPLSGQHCNSPDQHFNSPGQHSNNTFIGFKQHISRDMAQGHCTNSVKAEEHYNNLVKTEGEHSSDQSSLTDLSNRGRLMCPELAVSYTGTLIRKRAGCLASKQGDLEQRITALQKKIHLRQLDMVHSHVCRQLNFEGRIDEQESSNMEGSCSSLTDSDLSVDVSPSHSESQRGLIDRLGSQRGLVDNQGSLVGLIDCSEGLMDNSGGPSESQRELLDSSEGLTDDSGGRWELTDDSEGHGRTTDSSGGQERLMDDSGDQGEPMGDSGGRLGLMDDSGGQGELMDIQVQVDGDDAFLPEMGDDESRVEGAVRKRTGDSFSSSGCLSEVEEDGGTDALMAQLVSLESLLDGDLTEASSDEEGEESADLHYRHDLRCFWDHARSAVASRWAWLQRKIAELNKQIYRLDHHVKESCSQEKFMFGSPPSMTSASAATAAAAAAVLPQYMSLANGSVLEHFRAGNGGGGLIAAQTGLKVPSNGFSHHPHSAEHTHGFPHLLLPEGLLNSKLQVKDLLSPSSIDRSLLFINETSCSAARTRPLVRRVNRRVIRKKGIRGVRNNFQPVDVAFHPHLSMAHELPSRIPLDSALKNILSEHSYAQLPPLSKRRKAASTLTHLSTPLSHDYEHSRSASPSPVHTPMSLDSSRDGSARKRQLVPLLQYQTSVDSSGGSPWSPGISRPSTPSFTPLHSARKKRVTNSTPLFDIDNIVIPYSMASSTRLEKLEYKEILTPSWREVEGPVGPPPSPKQGTGDMEDCSNEAFATRHGRCELMEKKRFLNFISGSQRKRGRPQSMTLLDSPSLTSPPQAPPRRLTIASPSPTSAETELVTHIRTVVTPWQPRGFPLNAADQEALVTPPPPPIVAQPTSPLHFFTSTPSKTPSCTSSATPVGSPCRDDISVHRDTPAISPVEWIVNSQFPASSALQNHRTIGAADAATLMPSPAVSQNPIILKLTKKV